MKFTQKKTLQCHCCRRMLFLVFVAAFVLLVDKVDSFSSSSTQQLHSHNQLMRIRQQQQHGGRAMIKTTILFAEWTDSMGGSALRQVEKLASRVALSTAEKATGMNENSVAAAKHTDRSSSSITNGVYKNNAPPSAQSSSSLRIPAVAAEATESSSSSSTSNEQQVWTALESLERDMQMLDTLAGQRPQLSRVEFALLSLSVLAASSAPLLDFHITHFLPPAAAAFSASIGIGAEFVGKVAVADGKEVAAATIQCAAEAEGLLANAERAKAVSPLCVGIGATGASFALLAPVLFESLGVENNLQLVTELYLCCPLVSVLAAAVANLALQECKSYAQRAISVGNRRFAKSGLVGRTWLSATEQVESKSLGSSQKWKSFSLSVLPAPLVGAVVPGALPTKTIVVAALAAVQSAYFLTQAENTVARATDAVALKSRSAAVCDTYANQGARSSAILPFTSALSSLCAAATAAIVELPILDTFASVGGLVGVSGQMALVSVFPALSAMFAAAATVSKARCMVDAEAATQAASTMALEYQDQKEDDPVLRPFQGVKELIRLTTSTCIVEPLKRRRKVVKQMWVFKTPGRIWRWLVARFHKRRDDTSSDTATPTSDGSVVVASA